jgi:L-rhamnose mutarotase
MHAVVWPGVLAAIERCNIRNYSIYLGQIEPDQYIMFSYYEYVGDNFEEDMKGITDEVTRAWLNYTDKLQVPLEGRKEGEWWKTIEQIFHTD